MLFKSFYDPQKTYEENYEQGPFGEFSNQQKYIDSDLPKYTYHGYPVYLPFGIPAGPILNSNYVKAAFEKGFDIVVYKTVRTDSFPCHPYPNVLALHIDKLSQELMRQKIVADNNFQEPLSITNSFGVPSKSVKEWQEDVKKAIGHERKGQILVLSFMGTVRANQSENEFIEDYVLAARLAKETGVKVLEANLSCPNIGNEGLVCYNLDITKKICEAIRQEIGGTPLAIKIGYFDNDEDLLEMSKIAHDYVDEIVAINTLGATVVDSFGQQALPGPNRVKSGVCGTAIKWAGLEMVQRLKKIKEENNYKFIISGVGGVMNKQDYLDYKNLGADVVFSATGAMWNPLFAQEIKDN